MLNEKRNELRRIEESSNTRVFVIADPYKSRPYYKVIRIKASEVKNVDSYNLTPDSPTPDMNWRDDKNISKGMKPLVNAITPPKMPKKNGPGVMQILKKAIGLEDKKEIKKKPQRKRPQNKKNYQKNKINKNVKTSNTNKPLNKKKNTKIKAEMVEDKNDKTLKRNQNSNKKNNQNHKKNPNKNGNKKVNKAEKVTKANENKSNKDVNTKSVSKTEQSSKPKKSGLKPVESVKKEKKVVPTRAANDPRYKS